ncbi:MAG TPA: HlyD family secretion protein [Rhodopila sp.]|uniref:HlyD family secretion protein n=1 Tax=Rhodopila sp. TaxID=2480087 RepID=UPI002D008BC7|nr:HlyD family secretion protein [Rhodopila sp.]HVY16749.1 HlyD family secretion protein [Rhodopila sp.]
MSQAVSRFRDDVADRPRAGARSRRKLVRWTLMAGGVIAVVVGGGAWWLAGGRWVDTDDAYVQADSMTVSTDVSGIVASIPVHEGEAVAKGQVLFTLDPQKFRIALDNAQADLAQTRLNIESEKADYQAALRNADSRRQQVNADQATYDRYAALVKSHAVTQQETDDARYKLAADQQALSAAEAQARAQLAKLDGNPDARVEDMPSYKQAQARLDEAKREMDHSVVRAPYDGIVTQVNKLQLGMYLGASTAAFGLVSTDHVWVEAQPKETQLTHAKAGDPVDVTFDIYPDRTFKGTVQSIAPATDQNFSLLPAENSSGNWVKVVQRIPVRVRLDLKPGDPPMRAGMSADIDIDTGHARSLSDLF